MHGQFEFQLYTVLRHFSDKIVPFTSHDTVPVRPELRCVVTVQCFPQMNN